MYENILSKIHLHKIFYTTPKAGSLRINLLLHNLQPCQLQFHQHQLVIPGGDQVTVRH